MVVKRNKQEMRVLDFKLLERQLHVLLVVIIIQILAPVMHGKEVRKADILIKRLVFGKVPDERREFQYLIQ